MTPILAAQVRKEADAQKRAQAASRTAAEVRAAAEQSARSASDGASRAAALERLHTALIAERDAALDRVRTWCCKRDFGKAIGVGHPWIRNQGSSVREALRCKHADEGKMAVMRRRTRRRAAGRRRRRGTPVRRRASRGWSTGSRCCCSPRMRHVIAAPCSSTHARRAAPGNGDLLSSAYASLRPVLHLR